MVEEQGAGDALDRFAAAAVFFAKALPPGAAEAALGDLEEAKFVAADPKGPQADQAV